MHNHSDSVIIVLASSTVLLVTVFIIIYNWQRRHLYYYASKIPGPLALPLIGTAYIFLWQKDFFQVLVDGINSYPSVLKGWLGSDLYIFTSRPQDVEIVLNNFLEKPNVYKLVTEAVHNSLPAAPVKIWKKNRKFLNHTFNLKTIMSFYDTFTKHSKHLVKSLENVCGKEQTDLMTKMWEVTMAAAIETLFDVDPPNSNSIHELILSFTRSEQISVERIHKISLILKPVWKLSALYKEDAAVVAKIVKFLQNMIDQKTKVLGNIDIERKQRLFNYMLSAEQKNGLMSREQIIQESFMMLATSSETTAISISSVMLLLGMYPEIQDRAYQEIISVTRNDDNICLENLKKMDYLERVIKETLRLFPPLPFAMRYIDKNIHSDPYVFPAGSNIYVPIMQIHRNAELWPDPFKFDPDRFLPEEVEKRHRCAFIPFSIGVRNCIGFQYALLQMKCLTANIVRNFKMTTLSHKSVESIEVEFHIAIKPKDYKVLLEKREK